MSEQNEEQYQVPFAADPLEFSGERFISGCSGEIENEHYHRYLFALQICANRAVLDIACGDGYGSALLSSVAESVIGVDISRDAVAAAEKNYGSNKLTFREGSCTAIPVEDASIDVLISFETIEHFKGHEQFISEVKRVLRPNGLFLISSPDREIYTAPGKATNPYHVKELTREEFVSLISGAFSNIELLEQKATTGSIIVPALEAKSRREGEFETFFHVGDRTFRRIKQLHDAVYLLIVASDGELPIMQWGLHDNPEYLTQLQQEVVQVSNQLATVRAEVNAEVERHRASAQMFSAVRDNLDAQIKHLSEQLDQRSHELAQCQSLVDAQNNEMQRIKQSFTVLELCRTNLRAEIINNCARINRLMQELKENEIELQSFEGERTRYRSVLVEKDHLAVALENERQERLALANSLAACNSSYLLRALRRIQFVKRNWRQSLLGRALRFFYWTVTLKLPEQLKLRREMKIIRESGLFSDDYYLRCHPGLISSGVDPLLYYLVEGVSSGANPHPLFDADFYEKSEPGLSKGINPLLDYITAGENQKRSPHVLFDSNYYQAQRPQPLPTNPLQDFLERGAKEGSSPHPLFDTSYYLRQNPDVASSGVNPLIHYLECGANEGRDPHPLFNTRFYLEKNPDVLLSGVNPLIHFIRFGASEQRNPHPLFITSYYLKQLPGLLETGENPLEHFILNGSEENASPSPLFNVPFYLKQLGACDTGSIMSPSLVKRKLLVGAGFKPALTNEERSNKNNPLIHYLEDGWKNWLNPHPDFNTRAYYDAHPESHAQNPLVHFAMMKDTAGQKTEHVSVNWSLERALTTCLEDLLIKAQGAVYSHFIVVPFLTHGGADLTAVNYAKVIAEQQRNMRVLLIVADSPKVDPSSAIPAGVDFIVLDDYWPFKTIAERSFMLESLIQAVCPEVVHNVNSEALWQLIIKKGEKLSRITRIFGSIFAFQFADSGEKIGYAAQFFEKSFPYLSGLIADNYRFIRDLIAEYDIKERQNLLHVVYNPARISPMDAFSKQSRAEVGKGRMNVLWAGRFDKEKRLDVLIEVAKKAQFADFHLFGKRVVDHGDSIDIPALPNLFVHGPFSEPGELLQERNYQAFIFTSKWEGLPNILLEIGCLGVPIIAADVGGVSELVSPNTGYLVSAKQTPQEFIAALEEIKTDQEEATRRADNLKRLISERHSWKNFCRQLSRIKGYL